MAHHQKKNAWANMSERWAAEESGIPPKRNPTVPPPVPEPVVYDDDAMDVDVDMTLIPSQSGLVVEDSSSDEELNDVAPGAYGETIKHDPRPRICYDEIETPPPPVIPRRDLTVRVNQGRTVSVKSRLGNANHRVNDSTFGVEDKVPRYPSYPRTSVRSRLGSVSSRNQDEEEGEVKESDSDTDDDDDIKNNLGAAWSKKLVGPRMRMYADEEDQKRNRKPSWPQNPYASSSKCSCGSARCTCNFTDHSFNHSKRLQQQPRGIRRRDYDDDDDEYSGNSERNTRFKIMDLGVSRRIPVKERLGHRVRR